MFNNFPICHKDNLDESILDNICLHEDYSKEELQSALSDSGLLHFIEQVPNGLEYHVGENGNNLSGGQKQRIAVARALIRKKPLLILDEGTSAIDMQTAYDIESRLLEISDLTLLTITHNMSRNPNNAPCNKLALSAQS